MVNSEYIYKLLPVHKAQKEFFDHQFISPTLLAIHFPHFKQIGTGCPALRGDHFKMTPHFKQLCCMDSPFLAFRGKRVANREKSSYYPIHNFFCSLFVYLLKKLKEIILR